MRTKEELLETIKYGKEIGSVKAGYDAVLLEVLLDIRDLLNQDE